MVKGSSSCVMIVVVIRVMLVSDGINNNGDEMVGDHRKEK